MIRLGPIAAALAVLVATAPGASAQTVADAKNHLEVGAKGWQVTIAAASEANERLVASATHDSGEAAASVVRIDYPNTPAWRQQKSYFDDVVAGLKAASSGFVLESSKTTKVGRVPVLDVRYRRDDKGQPHVAVRFVFFRTFTLIAVATADRERARAAQSFARSLTPKP